MRGAIVASALHELSKPVRFNVGFDQCLFSCMPRIGNAVFHSKDALKFVGMDVSEDITVIDFTRARFFASRVVANLEVTNLIPTFVDVGNQIW